MSGRFSKQAVLNYLERRSAHYAEEFRRSARRPLGPRGGWAQCDGLPTEAAIAFGHWRALQDLADNIHWGSVEQALEANDGRPPLVLHRVTLTLCSLCLAGAGGECHTPGCALWLRRAPDVALDLEMIEIHEGLAP